MMDTFKPWHLFFFLAMSLAAFPLMAGDWPDNPEGVTESFGAARDGSFVSGLEFRAEGQRIQTWSSGEVIWSSGPGHLEGAVHSEGLIVIEHPDGFRSGYLEVEARPDLDNHISAGQWIGYAGDDSWTFSVQDSEMRKTIDPLTLLPTREGLEPPRLGKVELVSGNNSLPLENGMEIGSGIWSIVVDAAFSGTPQAIPVELSFFWVGQRVGSMRFDSLEERDGEILMDAPDAVSYEVVYDEEGNLAFRDILLNAGRGILELRMKDESGRVIRKTWNLSIRSL